MIKWRAGIMFPRLASYLVGCTPANMWQTFNSFRPVDILRLIEKVDKLTDDVQLGKHAMTSVIQQLEAEKEAKKAQEKINQELTAKLSEAWTERDEIRKGLFKLRMDFKEFKERSDKMKENDIKHSHGINTLGRVLGLRHFRQALGGNGGNVSSVVLDRLRSKADVLSKDYEMVSLSPLAFLCLLLVCMEC